MIKNLFLFYLAISSSVALAQNIKHIRFGSTDTPLTGLTIIWRSPGTADQIQWGYTKGYEKGQYSGSIRTNYAENQFDYLFPAPVTANSTIYYKIYDSQAALWTSQRSFKTASDPTSNKFNFTAMGDSRTYYTDWQTIGNCAAVTTSDFVLFGGDLVDDGSNSTYYDTWFDFGSNFLSKKLVYYTIGNHESTASVAGLSNYMGLFTMPGNKEYFSFTHGNALFMVINSEKPGNAGQLSWVQSTLVANSDKTWKFILFHKPFFTGPAHIGEMDGYFSTLWKAFDDYGVDMIFNGHTHNYQRTKPINRNVSTTSPVAEYGSNPGQGRCEVVTGAAGAPLSGLAGPSWWLENTRNELNYCDIAVDGSTLTFRAFNSSQAVIDQFQIVKGTSVLCGGVSVYPSAVTLAGGANSQLTPIFTPANTTNKLISWTTNAPSVATVNSLGIVTGIGAGVATITATTVTGGFTSSCTVTCSAPQIIVGTGNSWKFLDDGTDLGIEWRTQAFNDALWLSGPSPLGYGAITNVPLGTGNLSASRITYYFRKFFNYTVTGNETAFQLRVMIDDGCIVYFNGTEVYRNRLTDPVNYLTLAGNEASEGTYYTVNIPVSAVVNGLNTIAVEAHNTAATSSDLGFDLILTPILSTPVSYNALVSVFMDGVYDATPGLMSTKLNTGSRIPLSQPFGTLPWNYFGTEHVDVIPSGVVDWVLVELRQSVNPADALPATRLTGWPKAYFLKSDGVIVDLDGTTLPVIGNPEIANNLYIVVRHRNHIAIMSSVGMNISGSNFVYDFSDAVSKAHGSIAGYRQIVPGVFGMVSGDTDGDGTISVLDFSKWATDFGKIDIYLPADIDGDGEVSVLDFSKWATNFGIENIDPLKKLNLQGPKAANRFRFCSQVP